MKKWFLFILLMSMSSEASARIEPAKFLDSIKRAKYSVLAKATKAEVVGFCGQNLTLEVIEDLKGNAPKQISVSMVEPVLPGRVYFMNIYEGKAEGMTDTPMKMQNTAFGNEIKKKGEKCRSGLFELHVGYKGVGEIIEKGRKVNGSWINTKWLKKPELFKIPDTVDVIEYISIEGFQFKGKASEIKDRSFDGITTEKDNAVIVFDKELADRICKSPVTKESQVQNVIEDDPFALPDDYVAPPIHNVRFKYEYGEVLINWDQLRKVWDDRASNSSAKD